MGKGSVDGDGRGEVGRPAHDEACHRYLDKIEEERADTHRHVYVCMYVWIVSYRDKCRADTHRHMYVCMYVCMYGLFLIEIKSSHFWVISPNICYVSYPKLISEHNNNIHLRAHLVCLSVHLNPLLACALLSSQPRALGHK